MFAYSTSGIYLVNESEKYLYKQLEVTLFVGKSDGSVASDNLGAINMSPDV
jgi:hypothetical protein